jgi:hypothetical protein
MASIADRSPGGVWELIGWDSIEIEHVWRPSRDARWELPMNIGIRVSPTHPNREKAVAAESEMALV